MRNFFGFCAILLVSFTACNQQTDKKEEPVQAVQKEDFVQTIKKKNTRGINIDSILALPDTLEWGHIHVPAKADGLFEDFLFNFVRNSRFQEERINFPLPVQKAGKISHIERKDWDFDRLEVLQEVNTNIFDEEKDFNYSQDSTINEVKVEFIYFNCDSVKQYVFKRLDNRWKLTKINWEAFKHHANGEFYAFYEQFANDFVFQRKRVRNPFEFKTYDEFNDEEIFGEVEADAWCDYCPELPTDILTNINYGQCRHDSRKRYVVIISPSAGMASTLKFQMIKWQWKLVGLEN